MEGDGVKSCVVRVLCDSVAIAFLVIFLIIGTILENNGIVTRRGFYCDDESIRYPYRPDTVPTWALVVGSVGIPLVAVSRARRVGGQLLMSFCACVGVCSLSAEIFTRPFLVYGEEQSDEMKEPRWLSSAFGYPRGSCALVFKSDGLPSAYWPL